MSLGGSSGQNGGVDELRQTALRELRGVESTPKNLLEAGGKYGDEVARWAFAQWELRGKGKAKFLFAEKMWFTRDGLEMASHEEVARWHARLFEPGMEVWDLGCGIGADLVAFARRGPVIGMERDLETRDAAVWNLRTLGGEGKLIHGEVDEKLLGIELDGVYCDPARRAMGERLSDPGEYSPRLELLLEVMKRARRGVLKLSPMLNDEFLLDLEGDLWFVSHGGECKEALVVFGEGVTGARRAVHIETGDWVSAMPVAVVDVVGGWIYQADRAAIRGHCLGGFGLESLGDVPGWLTGGYVKNHWLAGYQVVWSGGWRDKVVRKALRDLGGRVSVVKTRGVSFDPETVRRGLPEYGGKEVVLWLYRVGKSVKAVISLPKHVDEGGGDDEEVGEGLSLSEYGSLPY